MSKLLQTIKESNIEARPYQQTLIGKTVDMFCGDHIGFTGEREEAARSVLVESPTGSGKTVCGHLIAKLMQKTYPNLVVGWVAMRRNLLSQAAIENKRIKVDNIHYISMFDKNPEALVRARAEGKKILMIVDECQHDAASSMASLHSLIRPDWILGLTATPFRTDRMKLCFDKVVKDAGIHRLIQDGYLSEFAHYNIEEWTPENVAWHYCEEPDKWGLSVVFFHKWEDVVKFESLVKKREREVMEKLRRLRPDLPLANGLVRTVRGGGSSDERDELLDKFRKGNIAVLANCMVLTEGFDAPNLETAFVRDSEKGPTIQMAGRAFRLHPQRGTDERFKIKNVVQSKMSSWSMQKTATAKYQYIWQEGEWRSLTINPNINKISLMTRKVICDTQVTMPKFIGNQTKRRFRAD